MGWRWGAVLVIAVAVSVGAWIAVASRGSSNPPPAKPGLAKPSSPYLDDADMMRRLERPKLVRRHQ